VMRSLVELDFKDSLIFLSKGGGREGSGIRQR